MNSPSQDPAPTVGDAGIDSPPRDAIAAIDAFLAAPPSFARANKKGNFPMAAMKLTADGASYDMVPLTIAMTEETFDRLREIVSHLPAARDALAAMRAEAAQ